jgi:hypothetical protein
MSRGLFADFVARRGWFELFGVRVRSIGRGFVRGAPPAVAVRQTVRAFASAGIRNRVVALFDNDTAARDVVRTIAVAELPPNIVIEHLSELPLARSYPTEGAQGANVMDVNARAASIELYLGVDALTDSRGFLRPVRWGGHNPGVGDYHGEVIDKIAVHRAFETKVRLAEELPNRVVTQDWSSVDLIIDHVPMPTTAPSQRGSDSPLSKHSARQRADTVLRRPRAPQLRITDKPQSFHKRPRRAIGARSRVQARGSRRAG